MSDLDPVKASNQPSSALKKLGQLLVGSWKVAGGANGLVRYGWAEGGLFLIQHVDIKAFDRAVAGIEIIGHLRRVGGEPSAEIWSRFYSYGDGLTLDYVYELNAKELVI